MKQFNELSFFEQLVVRHAHPASMVCHLLGFMWGGYFLWQHNLYLGIICFLVIPVLGHVYELLDKDYLLMCKEKLNLFQQLLVYHTEVRNLIFHIISFVVFTVGCWQNSFVHLLAAASLALIGHIFPWVKHHKECGQHAKAVD